MNGTLTPEVTRTARGEASWRPVLQRFLEKWSSSARRLATAWRGHQKAPAGRGGATQSQGNPWYIAGFVLVVLLLSWHFFTLRSTFDQRGLSEEQLQMMEFNGDIVRGADGTHLLCR